jgi:hypothetical protein
MPWGVENLTKEERYKKAIEAGVNLFSGESDPAMLIHIIDTGMVDISYIDNSVPFKRKIANWDCLRIRMLMWMQRRRLLIMTCSKKELLWHCGNQ